MSKLTKNLPDERTIKRWAKEHKNGSCLSLDAMAAEILRLRAEVQRLESERVGAKQAWEKAWSEPKDAPPADVLGEAFRKHLEGVNDIEGGLDKRLVCTFYALLELSDVVERLAVNQQGLKSLDEKISETIYCADPSKICPWLDRNNGESVENYVRRKMWESLVLLARRMGIEVRK